MYAATFMLSSSREDDDQSDDASCRQDNVLGNHQITSARTSSHRHFHHGAVVNGINKHYNKKTGKAALKKLSLSSEMLDTLAMGTEGGVYNVPSQHRHFHPVPQPRHVAKLNKTASPLPSPSILEDNLSPSASCSMSLRSPSLSTSKSSTVAMDLDLAKDPCWAPLIVPPPSSPAAVDDDEASFGDFLESSYEAEHDHPPGFQPPPPPRRSSLMTPPVPPLPRSSNSGSNYENNFASSEVIV